MTMTAKQLLNECQRRTRTYRNFSTGIRKYQLMKDQPNDYIVFDFQTTGNRPGADKIIHIGAIKYIDKKEREVYQTLINPRRYIPDHVAKRTGITNYMAEHAPFIEDEINRLLDFIGTLPIITHNASMHMNFLYTAERTEGINLPEFKVIDTARLARKRLAKISNQELIQLTKYLQLEHDGLDTIDNCYAINEIYQLCIE